MSIYTFTNGTQEQRALWQEASEHLLSFSPNDLGLDITITFEPVANVVSHGHTDLALTFFTVGSAVSTTKVRFDAPAFGDQRPALLAEAAKFGVPFNSERFYQETAIHELGHSMFASLPPRLRLRIVELFGADSAEESVIAPAGSLWQNRIAEGIAETFKEAFLPARYRVFPNRTNRKIPYALYPKFRSYFRGSGSGFSYIYGSSDFRIDLTSYGVELPTHRSDRDPEAFVFYEEIVGFQSCWGVDMSQFAESGHHPFSIRPAGGDIS